MELATCRPCVKELLAKRSPQRWSLAGHGIRDWCWVTVDGSEIRRENHLGCIKPQQYLNTVRAGCRLWEEIYQIRDFVQPWLLHVPGWFMTESLQNVGDNHSIYPSHGFLISWVKSHQCLPVGLGIGLRLCQIGHGKNSQENFSWSGCGNTIVSW